MKDNAYILKLKNKLKELGVRKGSTIIVCVDILKFLILLKKKINFNLEHFINLLINLVGKKEQ